VTRNPWCELAADPWGSVRDSNGLRDPASDLDGLAHAAPVLVGGRGASAANEFGGARIGGSRGAEWRGSNGLGGGPLAPGSQGAASCDVGRRVATSSTTQGRLFEWLLEAGSSGALRIAADLFFDGIVLAERLMIECDKRMSGQP